MGHLTFIAEEVVKLLDRYAVEIGDKVGGCYSLLPLLFIIFCYLFIYFFIHLLEFIEAEDWQEYVSKTLRETRDRDREPLGGQRPTNLDSMSPSRDESEEEEEDDTIEGVADGDMASDQVGYLYYLFHFYYLFCSSFFLLFVNLFIYFSLQGIYVNK